MVWITTDGQLGVNTRESHSLTFQQVKLPQSQIPNKISAGADHSLILCKNGNVYRFGRGYAKLPELVSLPNGQKAKDIGSGWGHSLILLENGDLYHAGSIHRESNSFQHYNLPPNIKIKKIAVSYAHNLLIVSEDRKFYLKLLLGEVKLLELPTQQNSNSSNSTQEEEQSKCSVM